MCSFCWEPPRCLILGPLHRTRAISASPSLSLDEEGGGGGGQGEDIEEQRRLAASTLNQDALGITYLLYGITYIYIVLYKTSSNGQCRLGKGTRGAMPL